MVARRTHSPWAAVALVMIASVHVRSDTIITRDNKRIEGKVVEVGDSYAITLKGGGHMLLSKGLVKQWISDQQEQPPTESITVTSSKKPTESITVTSSKEPDVLPMGKGPNVIRVRVMDAVIMAGGGTGLSEEKKNGVYVGGLCFASPATAFKYITNLNQKNFVRKEIDGGDRRANILTVTGLGRKLLEEVGA